MENQESNQVNSIHFTKIKNEKEDGSKSTKNQNEKNVQKKRKKEKNYIIPHSKYIHNAYRIPTSR